eukprot:2189025-Alexandrium_andersonii.AAC.1
MFPEFHVQAASQYATWFRVLDAFVVRAHDRPQTWLLEPLSRSRSDSEFRCSEVAGKADTYCVEVS